MLTCVVTHDRLGYTERCVGSWLRTRRPQDRLVIVDNASTDGTPVYLDMCVIEDGAVLEVIFNDENRFPGAACNQGWDRGLERWGPNQPLLHRSDNDIEYLPGWQDEVERAYAEFPELALLGVLNLHEDRGVAFPDGPTIEPVQRVGGNVVMPTRLFREGLRWDERPWQRGIDEDGPMSWKARELGMVARLGRTVAHNMAFNGFWEYPEYYRRTAELRGIADAEHST